MIDIDSITAQQVMAVFMGLNTICVIIALRNIGTISKTQRMAALKEFHKELTETSEDRRFVFREFTFPATDNSLELPADARMKLENVINSLNRVGLLLEHNMLPAPTVLGMCHTLVIRSWYKIEPYIQYHERRIGWRYGRRITRLAQKAKNYHDSNPKHRATTIRLDSGTEQVHIYETSIKHGIKGIIQKMLWTMRRITSIY